MGSEERTISTKKIRERMDVKKRGLGENRTIKGKMNVKTIERVFSLSN